jgi:Lrp/AsnC family transcriptional regulator, leucine-responsive regulatory protein
LLDTTDKAIIDIIKNNSRIQWREIGEMVHLTGQAVGNRIRRMEEMGLIKGYTVDLDYSKLGQPLTAFVTVFMKSTNHMGFQKFLSEKATIVRADRISGDGCYLLEFRVASHEELTEILNQILEFGNYRVDLSIGKVK